MPSLLSCGEQDLNPGTQSILTGFQGFPGDKPPAKNPAKTGVGETAGSSVARVCDGGPSNHREIAVGDVLP